MALNTGGNNPKFKAFLEHWCQDLIKLIILGPGLFFLCGKLKKIIQVLLVNDIILYM